MSEKEQELKQLRERRAKLAERISVEPTLDEQIEAEQRALIDDEAIAAAVEQHGKIGKELDIVRTDIGAIVVKRPNPLIYKRFMDSGSSKYEEFDKLVRPCLVHPTKARWDEMLDQQPAIMVHAATAVCKLAGARLGELAGK